MTPSPSSIMRFDYNPTFDFAAEDVPGLRREVEEVSARIRALLAAAREGESRP